MYPDRMFENNNEYLSFLGRVGAPAAMGVGNIYYVIKPTQAFYNQFVDSHEFRYPDGTKSIHTDIQSGLNACVADRNDYVVVMPDSDTIYLDATLTMSKACVHLVCPAGILPYVGASNAARVIQRTASTNWVTISADKVEIAGFFVRPVDMYPGIVFSGARAACNIHHNTILGTLTDTAANMYMIHGDGVNQFHQIYRNWIICGYNCPASLKTMPAAISFENGSGGRNMIVENHISTGRSTTVTGGVVLSGLMNYLVGNWFFETTIGDSRAGVFTKAWNCSTDTFIADNRLAMATPATTGGVLNVTNVLNYSSTNAGALIVAS
jgi:hypothetical protein